MEASRGNKLEKTNVLTSITLTNKQRNREENFRILELQLRKRKCKQQRTWIKMPQTTGYAKEHAYRKNTDCKVYRKCEIQDQNDAPHMRTKEATHHEKRSQKGGATYWINKSRRCQILARLKVTNTTKTKLGAENTINKPAWKGYALWGWGNLRATPATKIKNEGKARYKNSSENVQSYWS